jgi:hypothetical protein
LFLDAPRADQFQGNLARRGKVKKQRPKSDSSGSIRWGKIDGTPLNKKEVAKAERLLRTYMESPPKALLEGPITLHHETLDRWLIDKFGAIYDLSVLYGKDVTDKPRERFIDVLRQISYEYMRLHLDRAISAAFYMVASIWHVGWSHFSGHECVLAFTSFPH